MTPTVPAYASFAGRQQVLPRHRALKWLSAGYLVLLPVQLSMGESVGFRFAPSDIFLLLYVIVAAPTLSFYRPRVWSGWHVAVLFAFAMATLTGAMNHGEVSKYVFLNKDIGVLILYLAYVALTGEATTWPRIRDMLRLFILAVAFFNTLALVSYFGLSPWLSNNVFIIAFSDRLAGMLIDPNAYGGLLAVAFAIHAITYCSPKPLVGGLVGFFILLSLLGGVFYTYSRSSWISVTFMIIVLCVVRPKVAILLLLIIVGGVALIVGTADRSSLDTMLYMSERPEQVEGRVDIITHAIPMFLNNPIVGVGLGSFEKSYGIIIHNTPVWFLTEFGLIGFISVGGLYIWYLRRGWRAYAVAAAEEKPLVLGLLLAHIAVLGLSMGIEAFYQRHWWLTIAMISAASLVCSTGVSGLECQERESEVGFLA